MEKFIERMCDESKELSAQIETIKGRADKLNEFINENPTFKSLDAESQDLLERQLNVMDTIIDFLGNYRDIVDERIARDLSK